MEVCSLRDAAEELADMGVEVYALSLDDVKAMESFSEDQELNFSLLSDPDGSVARKYAVLGGRGFANRVTFVLDDEGVLRHRVDKVNVRSHGTDLVAIIEKLQN